MTRSIADKKQPAPESDAAGDTPNAPTIYDVLAGLYTYLAFPRAVQAQTNYLACSERIEAFIKAAGDPTDPVERMLLEQMFLAHHTTGRLHIMAAGSSVQDASLYLAAATRLLGELRRTALSLKAYRGAAVAEHVTIVGQQNLAAGDQQVALMTADNAHRGADNTFAAELRSCPTETKRHALQSSAESQERPIEGQATWALDLQPGAASPLPRSHLEKEALAPFDRPEDSSGQGEGRAQWEATPEGASAAPGTTSSRGRRADGAARAGKSPRRPRAAGPRES